MPTIENDRVTHARRWRRFVATFMAVFVGGIATVYAFVLLVDPYDLFPLHLPFERRLVSISQRYMYPQIVRSGKFDSFVIGTSTSRLLDPQQLGASFGGRFANLAMDSMTAWEQHEVMDYFLRKRGPPKFAIVALDTVWCDIQADRNRITFRGFPDWLYDDNPWNDYLYLLNTGVVELAGRLVGNWLGLYPERVRYDGFEVFVPRDSDYDAARAHSAIWQNRKPDPPVEPLHGLSDSERQSLRFPALAWLDESLAKLSPATTKILAYMPVHVAAQPRPGTHEAALETECKARIASIARARGARVVDWRIASPITREDTNYWDHLHYRLPIAQRIVRELVAAIRDGTPSADGSYRIVR